MNTHLSDLFTVSDCPNLVVNKVEEYLHFIQKFYQRLTILQSCRNYVQSIKIQIKNHISTANMTLNFSFKIRLCFIY